MKILNCLVCVLIMNLTLHSQVSNIKWLNTAMGSQDEWPRIVKTDLEGNVYVIGEFTSKNLLVNGVIIENKADSSISSIVNLFLIKYKKDGNLLWVKSIQSDGNFSVPRIDISSSNSIAISYDVINGSYVKNENNEFKLPKNFTGMVLNYLDDMGNLKWHKVLIDKVTCSNTAGIVFDNNENIIIGGITFSGTIKDETGNYVIKDSISIPKVFLLKFSKYGQIIWAKAFGSKIFDYLSAITIDNSNNIIAYGAFSGYQFEIDTFKIINRSKKVNQIDQVYYDDIFLAKLDSDGNTLWLNSIYGSKDDYSADKIATDQEGNIYAIGYFDSDTISFNDKIKLLKSKNPQNYYDLFYAKYKSNGELQWARKVDNGVVGGLDFITLTVSPKGHLFLAGNYDNTGFRSGEIVLPSYGLNDVFYFECDSSGDIITKGSLGSDDHEWITDIHVDIESNMYLLGTYQSNELKLGNTNLYNTSRDRSTDMYLIKICPDSLSSTTNPNVEKTLEIAYFLDQNEIKILGNERFDKCQLSIFNVSGQLIFSKVINGNDEYIAIPNLINGVYFISIRSGSDVLTSKFLHY